VAGVREGKLAHMLSRENKKKRERIGVRRTGILPRRVIKSNLKGGGGENRASVNSLGGKKKKNVNPRRKWIRVEVSKCRRCDFTGERTTF